MNQRGSLIRMLCQLLIVLAIAAGISHASTLTCNNGANLTCTFFVDIFTGTIYQNAAGTAAANPGNSAITVAPAGTSKTIYLPTWDTSTGSADELNVLTSVTMQVVEYASLATVSIQNNASSAVDFVNASTSVPMTISGPYATISAVTSTSVASGSVPSSTTVTNPVYGSASDSLYWNSLDSLALSLYQSISDPNAYTDAATYADSHTASYCEAAVASGGQGGTSYDTGTHSCLGVQTGTSSTTTPGAASFNPNEAYGGPGAAVQASNVSAFENGTSVSFTASAGSATFGGTEQGGNGDLYFGGNGSAGGILEVTYTAETEQIPEPATLLLVGTALLGAGFLRRKRTRNS